MKDTITVYKDHCHCGHDRSSHYQKVLACLCQGCDCPTYNHHAAPPLPPPTDPCPTWDDDDFDPRDPW